MASGPSEEDAQDALQGLAHELHAKLLEAEQHNIDKDARLAQTEQAQEQLQSVMAQLIETQQEFHSFKLKSVEIEAKAQSDLSLLLGKLQASERSQNDGDGLSGRMDRELKAEQSKLKLETSEKRVLERQLEAFKKTQREQQEQLSKAEIDLAQLRAEKQFLKAKLERQAAREQQLVESQRACEVALADMNALYEKQTDRVKEKQGIIAHLQKVMQDMLVKHHFAAERKCYNATKGLQQQLVIVKRELAKRMAAEGHESSRTARPGIKMGSTCVIASATGEGSWTAPLADVVPNMTQFE